MVGLLNDRCIRVYSEMNEWMDCIFIVSAEDAERAEKVLQEAWDSYWEDGDGWCYGNTCAVQFLLQVCADVVVLNEVICEITLGIPFGIPVFNNTDSQAVWINFLSHDMSSLFLV